MVKSLGLSCYALTVGAAAAMLAGCGGSQGIVFPRAAEQSRAPTSSNGYTILYRFNGGSDGAHPFSGLIAGAGKLYGATYAGGGTGCGSIGCGTIFSVERGQERVLYRFSNASQSDTAGPSASLLSFAGNLYGTTVGIGDYRYGTVFRFGLGGNFYVLHTFKNGKDGGNPQAPVVALNRKLYGTTNGYDTPGSVFELGLFGNERPIYDFKGGSDGSSPLSGLLPYKGELYGVTYSGGLNEGGIIYKITTTGRKRTVYEFKGSPADGYEPFAPLLLFHGKMYGTTASGGDHYRGTAFEFDPASNRERVIYSFVGGSSDGQSPQAGLIAVNGSLYGTTIEGGSGDGGVVFKLTLAGVERVLHIFSCCNDGTNPALAGLTLFDGKLYGTTEDGGHACGAAGCGIIYSIRP